MRVECRCLSGFSSSLIVGPGSEPARVPGGGVNCNDMQRQECCYATCGHRHH